MTDARCNVFSALFDGIFPQGGMDLGCPAPSHPLSSIAVVIQGAAAPAAGAPVDSHASRHPSRAHLVLTQAAPSMAPEFAPTAAPVPARGRITFVIGSLMVGGAERQLSLLARSLAARGWSVRVFALEASGPLLSELERAGIEALDGGVRSGRGTRLVRLLSLLRAQVRLTRHMRACRPDVVHAFLPLTNFMGALAGRAMRVPFVVTSKRALASHQDRHPSLRWLDHVANRLSHRVTANSRAVALDCAARDGYDASRIAVIRNGIDFSRYEGNAARREAMRAELGVTDADQAIVFVANLIPYKGHTELIDALARLAPEHPRARLFLVGDDRGIGGALRQQAEDRGVAGRLDIIGQRSDVPDVLAAMDIGVMASHEEGFSNALLEKLAAGLPVVATNVGGNPEALDGMPSCRLVQARDAPDLARGIAAVLSGLDEARAGADVRRRLIRERYSVAAMVDAFEALYEERLR
ncbi:MAG: glycosyltransferase [Hyphomicrobiaceae bacterium]|nr:glycosyltransferase [Hyphomicrobiaceae bacterium]